MHVAKRLQSLDKGEGLDFATAEALAFGSLMLEGKHVRLCGQDSGRVSTEGRRQSCVFLNSNHELGRARFQTVMRSFRIKTKNTPLYRCSR